MRRALPWLLALAPALACDQAGNSLLPLPVSDGLPAGCNPLRVPGSCLTPWPSAIYLKADPHHRHRVAREPRLRDAAGRQRQEHASRHLARQHGRRLLARGVAGGVLRRAHRSGVARARGRHRRQPAAGRRHGDCRHGDQPARRALLDCRRERPLRHRPAGAAPHAGRAPLARPSLRRRRDEGGTHPGGRRPHATSALPGHAAGRLSGRSSVARGARAHARDRRVARRGRGAREPAGRRLGLRHRQRRGAHRARAVDARPGAHDGRPRRRRLHGHRGRRQPERHHPPAHPRHLHRASVHRQLRRVEPEGRAHVRRGRQPGAAGHLPGALHRDHPGGRRRPLASAHRPVRPRHLRQRRGRAGRGERLVRAGLRQPGRRRGGRHRLDRPVLAREPPRLGLQRRPRRRAGRLLEPAVDHRSVAAGAR